MKVLIYLFFAAIIAVAIMFIQKRTSYKQVIEVKNVSDLKQNFVLDNPSSDGSDPTGGSVDYSYLFPKEKDGSLIANKFGNVEWSNIPDTELTKKAFVDNGNSFSLNVSRNDIFNSSMRLAGSYRLASRKLFKGGLFIFDVENIPFGCGVWPAIWLNGFVGAKGQYHEKTKFDIAKLVKSTVDGEKTCAADQFLGAQYKDEFMSQYLGKDVYPGRWPLGGEIDIIEQTNFSNTNLTSIHGGPKCEVSSDRPAKYSAPWISPEYEKLKLRSVCGQTASAFGNYSGCRSPAYSFGDGQQYTNNRPNCPAQSATNAGNSQINVPFGSFGPAFNAGGGGVYAVQWIPKEKIYIWFFPRTTFSTKFLSQPAGPLGNKPEPASWTTQNGFDADATLVATYRLNDPAATTEGCNFNFQSIIINTTIGGGWGGGVMPGYCSVNNNSQFQDYFNKCFHASPESANKDGVDMPTGCWDGAFSDNGRGKDAEPAFYSKIDFKIRLIRVFQNSETDESVW